MFRAGSVLAAGVLVGALNLGIASANVSLDIHTDPISLSQAVYAECFGLAPRADESPFGGAVAFDVVPQSLASVTPALIDIDDLPVVRLSDAAFDPRTVMPTAAPLTIPAYDPAYTTSIQGVDPVTTLAPAPSTARLAPFDGMDLAASPRRYVAPVYRFDLPSANGRSAFSMGPVLNPAAGFTAGAIGADANRSLPQMQASYSVPMRVGHVHFQTHATAGQAESKSLALRDQSVGEGATFNARLGKGHLGLDVSNQVEHLQLNQPNFVASSFDSTANVGLNGDNVPVFVPAYADVTKHTFSAGVAVPVSKRVTAALQVDSQHLLGGYGAPGLQNLDANNTIYGARVTYRFKGNEALSLSARQSLFQNNLIPSNAFKQTSATLNLTVKF